MFEQIKEQAERAVRELLEVSKLQPGDLLVIGCSSSEIMGERIGKGSSMEAAQAVYDGIAPVLKEQGILLAVQCCAVVVIHHVQGCQGTIQAVVAHHDGQFQQLGGNLGIFYTEQNLFIVLSLLMAVIAMLAVGQNNLL